MKPSDRLQRLLPLVVLAAILLLIYGVMLAFPAIKGYINQQDCVATGRTNCGG